MSDCRKYRVVSGGLVWLGVILLSFFHPSPATATEETFATLQVGAHVYTNVTVTTKAKNYVFILHSTGMENVKITDLPEDVRTQLGYVPEATQSQKASTWAKSKAGEFHIGQVKAAELHIQKEWEEQSAVILEKARALDRRLCGALMGGALLIYLFYSYCCMLICQKAGQEPSMLIWLPIFKMLPLLRAAGMSPFYFLSYALLATSPITHIRWCFKIAGARGKSGWTGFWLALPPTFIFAFLYLAFSAGVEPAAEQEDKRTARLMTLETV
jgi:hypothetical protein